MSSLGPTQEEYDSLIYKLATPEAELGQARKLLEAPAKVGWSRQFWSGGAVVALVVFLLLPGISHATEYQQKELIGLKGVGVLVESVRPEVERLGLTKDQIKTDVELRLRKAGVSVLTKEEWEKTPGKPYLYVNVNAFVYPDEPALCVYNIRMELQEMVTLDRGLRAPDTIWPKERRMVVGKGNIRKIRDVIGDQVDKFINEYLAANPKK
jgi:hypothetical protein